MKIMENFVLKIQEREEAIQLLAMDPQVYGELLTHHQRGHGVDEEALRIRIPPPTGHQNVPQMGTCRDTSLWWRRSTFDDLLIFSGILGNLQAKVLGQRWPREPTSLGSAGPPSRGNMACGLPVGPLLWASSPPIFFYSGKNYFGDFIPFGLRSKIRSEKSQKHRKKTGTGTWH